MTTPRLLSVTIGALLVICGAACSDDPQPRDPGTSRPTVATTTPSIDPRAQAAVDAYEAFWEAGSHAEQRPVRLTDPRPAGTDFTRYSWDPLRAEYATYVASLAEEGMALRGTPPQARVRVASVDLDASPYPTVVLKNCPTPAPDWHEVFVESGKRVPGEVDSSIPPPYELTVKVILHEGRWGAQSSTADRSRTCNG